MIYLIFVIVFIILGIYFMINFNNEVESNNILEGYINSTNKGFKCPDVLIQKGKRFFLYNSKLAKVPGVNPIEFQNLEDYTEFIDWQRSQGIRCPILFLQFSYNAQGDPTYKIRPSPTNLQGGLPSTPSTYIYPSNNNISKDILDIPDIPDMNNYSSETINSSIEEERNSGLLYSPNAMDDNWGGIEYTENMIKDGNFDGDMVVMY
jgi:hypothetical protein